jgi:hypothetical protein
VPGGPSDDHEVDGTITVRAASARTRVRLQDAGAVWASSPAVARELIEAGLPPGNVTVVPSPILPAAPGPGGGGILAVLPVHEPAQARLVLDALRLSRAAPVRLLPTVVTRHLDRQVAEILPQAELLEPCSDEARFAAMAAGADVVLAIDSTDRFERRALVAAGVGAAVITGSPAGPAAAVLGDPRAGDLEHLARLQAEPGDRLERARRVADACAPETVLAEADYPHWPEWRVSRTQTSLSSGAPASSARTSSIS